MQAEIITVGDEILIGQIVDTNSAWIGQQLNLIGIDVARITSISDTPEAIILSLESLLPTTKLVILTGGLGPTKDDLTKHTLAEYFKMDLIYKPEIFEHITQLFATMGRIPNELNRTQAMVPEGCRVLLNVNGTAPGMLFVENGRHYVSLPGVPFEMKGLMEKEVLPIVAKEIVRQFIFHKTLLTVGLPETELAALIADFENELPKTVKLAYLPKPGQVRLRLTARGQDEKALQAEMLAQEAKLKTALKGIVFGEEIQNMEAVIGALLTEKNQTLALAESCTGGYIAHQITSVAGSSRYFIGGIVSYANAIKTNFLQVPEIMLAANGAVSEVVVRQMVLAAQHNFGSDWAIATSGVAGPDGGTLEKPVGTVWIAIAGPTDVWSKKFTFGKNRELNIQKASLAALNQLRIMLLEV